MGAVAVLVGSRLPQRGPAMGGEAAGRGAPPGLAAGGAARLAGALWLFWWVRGYHSEGRRWVETLLERDLPPALRPAVTAVASFMAYTQGDHEMVERYSAETLELSRQTGDTRGAAYARFMRAVSATQRGDFEGTVPSFEKALTLFRRSGEEGMVPIARLWPGTILARQGGPARG